ncbi:hypothetical protein [Candidatus Neptunochlamydia vexilliferae]|uniref:Uncharacterized protein n=1 Tax=Candidatus Neptunichlamydia vexilliferae TaxID=1651774 RepID=A0ABS0AXT3_9BACT|nr:hypothetical protein [Candidatus Neptunochlamydia vexilliferae]MBF5058952.1 hypothetical protein [Candidatus Neptunochlamydia vexilliferae]
MATITRLEGLEIQNFENATPEYTYLIKIIVFFLSSGGVDNLKQALAIIKNYNITKLSKTEKKEVNALAGKISTMKDDIIRRIQETWYRMP